jgi:hypothetical protein
METYRAYLLNPAGRIMSALELEAVSAEAALQKALSSGHPHAIEVWRGRELLVRAGGGPDSTNA